MKLFVGLMIVFTASVGHSITHFNCEFSPRQGEGLTIYSSTDTDILEIYTGGEIADNLEKVEVKVSPKAVLFMQDGTEMLRIRQGKGSKLKGQLHYQGELMAGECSALEDVGP